MGLGIRFGTRLQAHFTVSVLASNSVRPPMQSSCSLHVSPKFFHSPPKRHQDVYTTLPLGWMRARANPLEICGPSLLCRPQFHGFYGDKVFPFPDGLPKYSGFGKGDRLDEGTPPKEYTFT